MRLIATCPDETKDTLIRELESLGATGIEPGYRAVYFEADERIFYEAHLKLRTASRIFKVLKDIPAKSEEMLFSQARRLPWHEIFNVNHGFLVEGVPADRGAQFMRANDISKKVREAIQDEFKKHTGEMPRVNLKEPKVVVVAYVAKGRCILSLDTTGRALHKRGYRLDGHPAPIKETLAASILLMAGYDGSQAFMDPMCGSGTIAAEAAMIALGKPPQMHRKKGDFNFEWLKDFNRDLWRQVQEEARSEREEGPRHPIVASDISAQFVEMARKNALRARVEKHIDFKVGRFQDAEAPAESGILVANLPYGERLSKDAGEDLKALYKEIGDTLKKKFTGWRAVLLAAEGSPYKFIGLKPTRKIPVLNGSIACKILIFDMYTGTKKPKSPATEE